jgi:menaquinone-dependent protoporphyrinogen oxidase
MNLLEKEQTMSILVGYVSKHGATQQIADHIAETLQAAGHEAVARPMKATGDIAGYDAFVLGSAVYFGSWVKEAVAFLRRNRATLSARPTWLFSCGPLGTRATDAQGRDLREVAEPKEIAEFKQAISPRDHRVFFGALDHTRFGFAERLVWALPAGRALLIEGDFRDWQDIETWATGIGQALEPLPATR